MKTLIMPKPMNILNFVNEVHEIHNDLLEYILLTLCSEGISFPIGCINTYLMCFSLKFLKKAKTVLKW